MLSYLNFPNIFVNITFSPCTYVFASFNETKKSVESYYRAHLLRGIFPELHISYRTWNFQSKKLNSIKNSFNQIFFKKKLVWNFAWTSNLLKESSFKSHYSRLKVPWLTQIVNSIRVRVGDHPTLFKQKRSLNLKSKRLIFFIIRYLRYKFHFKFFKT